MSEKTFKLGKISRIEMAGVLVLIIFFILPFLSLAGGKKIYVDDDASGIQDGTRDYPYKTIGEAIKHADEKTEIHVSNGLYRENITISEGVELYGENKDKTIIVADDKNEPTVKMDHKTKIDKFTIKRGENGVEVKKNSRASIVKCVIEENDGGIRIKEAGTKDKYSVNITDSIIRNNDRSGIFAEKRRIVLINNEISGNEKDGAELSAGTSAWMKDNKFKNNDGSGMKVVLDGSAIWTDNNSFSDNNREGVEINAYGAAGRINLKDSKFTYNDHWGVARVKKGNFSNAVFNGITIQKDNKFWENKKGDISAIIRIL